MATLSNGLRGRGRGGAARSSAPRPPKSEATPLTATPTAKETTSESDGPEAALRKKYAGKVSLAKELFPDWADDDLFSAINDAQGDLETAINRITEGHAQQWSAAGKKKQSKRDDSAPPAFAGERRGRGDGIRGGRGGRGGRGARGGGAGRGGSRANGGEGHSGGYGKADNDFTSSSTPSAWGDSAATHTGAASWADDVATATPSATNGTTDASDWGAESNDKVEDAPPPPAAADDGGWGVEPATTTTDAPAGWGDDSSAKPAAAVKVPAKGKTIQPGTKFSWAQIAKPADIAKPTPPPSQKPAAAPAPVAQKPEPPVIELPTEKAVENIVATQTSHNVDPWASTPAAAAEPWEARPIGGVGEGWAETVLAADNESSAPSADAADTNSVGEELPTSAITANLEAQAAQQHPQELVNKPLNSVIGPPGLTKRGSQRDRQDAPVVMPNDQRSPGQGAEPPNLQFGSLALFDSRSLAGEHLHQEDTAKVEQDASRQPQESSYAATAAQQILAPEQRPNVYEHQQMQEKAPLGPPGQQAPSSQQVPQQQQPQAPYGGYGGYQDPHSAYANSPYASLGADNYYGSAQSQQQGQQQGGQQPQAASAPQQPGQHQSSYSAPGQQGMPPSSASQYQPFGNSTPDYGQQSQQQAPSSLPDSQRSAQASYYDHYAQAQSGYPRSSMAEDSKPAGPTSQVPTSQPQQGLPGLGHNSQPSGGYPNMAQMYPGYSPYGGYYQQQQQPYGYPANYYNAPQAAQAAQAAYGQPSPYGQAYSSYYAQPQRGAGAGYPSAAGGGAATSGTGAPSAGSYGRPSAGSGYGAPSPYGSYGSYPGQQGLPPQGQPGGRDPAQQQAANYKDAFYQ